MGSAVLAGLLLVLCCGLAVPQQALAQSLDIQKIANNSTLVLSGYNATGAVQRFQRYSLLYTPLYTPLSPVEDHSMHVHQLSRPLVQKEQPRCE